MSETATADGDTLNENINDDEQAQDEHTQDEHIQEERAKDEHTQEEHTKNERVKHEHTQVEHAKDEHIQDEHILDNNGYELIVDISNEDRTNEEQSPMGDLKPVEESSKFFYREPTFMEVENPFQSTEQPEILLNQTRRKDVCLPTSSKHHRHRHQHNLRRRHHRHDDRHHAADRKTTAVLKATKHKRGEMETNDGEPQLKASRIMNLRSR